MKLGIKLYLTASAVALTASPAFAGIDDHACLDDTLRTITSLPVGESVSPQDTFIGNNLARTVEGDGTKIVAGVSATWGHRLRNPAGVLDETAFLHTCTIGTRVDGPCDASVTWEECKADHDFGGIHQSTRGDTTIQGGDTEFAYIHVREVEDGILTPRAAPAFHDDGSDLHYRFDHVVLLGRDDAIELDSCPSATIKDSYLGGFVGVSARPGGTQQHTTNDPVVTIAGTVLMDLYCQPGEGAEGHVCVDDTKTIGRMWKWPGTQGTCISDVGGNAGPRLVVDGDLLIRLEDGDAGRMTWPEDTTINGSVTIYWNGPGDFPGYEHLPSGDVTVVEADAPEEPEAVEGDDEEFRRALEDMRSSFGCASDLSDCTWRSEVIAVTADGYISEHAPSTSFGGSSDDIEADLVDNNNKETQGYIVFDDDFLNIDPADVLEATLVVESDNATTTGLAIYPLLVTVTEGTTWNSVTGGFDAGVDYDDAVFAEVSTTPQNDLLVIDITGVFLEMLDQASVGIAVIAGGSDGLEWHSREDATPPSLVVVLKQPAGS